MVQRRLSTSTKGLCPGGIKKGSVFEYSSNGDGTVDIDKLTATTTQVKTYDKGSGEITFADTVTNLTGSNAKIDAKDTTVLVRRFRCRHRRDQRGNPAGTRVQRRRNQPRR